MPISSPILNRRRASANGDPPSVPSRDRGLPVGVQRVRSDGAPLSSGTDGRNGLGNVLAVLAVASGSGLIAAVSGCAPTGLHGWDVALTSAFAAFLVLAASVAPPAVSGMLLIPLIAAGPPGHPPPRAGAGPSLLLAEPEPVKPKVSVASSVVAAVATVFLLRLPALGFFGLPSMLVAAALVPQLISLLARLPRRGASAAVLVIALAGTAVLATAAAMQGASARADALAGAAAARRGLQVVRDGDQEAAARDLAQAASLFGTAHDRLDTWWLRPLRLVPLAGQNLSATTSLVGVGESVSAAAAQAATVDLRAVWAEDGSLDVVELARARPRLAALEQAITEGALTLRAMSDTPWLLPVLRANMRDVTSDLQDAWPSAELGRRAAEALPRLLGGEAPRRYLVMFANPAEARELGGIMGSYLEITAEAGRVRVTSAGSAATLNSLPPSRLTEPARFTPRFLINDPLQYSQNWTGMTDLISVAAAAADLYQTRGGRSIDGVMYVDPQGIASLMALTGPVEVPGVPYRLTSENISQFLLTEQYRIFEDHAERKDLLNTIGAGTFTRLLRVGVPDPGALEATLGPAVRGGHLQMESFDDQVNGFLEAVRLRKRPANLGKGDHLFVVHANGAANKLDAFLHRHVRYDVELDAVNGALTASASVRLENRATDDLPAYVLGAPVGGVPGTNLVQLSIYTPHALKQAEVDGRAVEVEAQHERGLNRYLVQAPVQPGATALVNFELTGSVDTDDGEYHLSIGHQPVVHPDRVEVTVSLSRGSLKGASSFRRDGDRALTHLELREPIKLSLGVARDR